MIKNEKYAEFTISLNDAEKRLDNIIRRFLPDMPLKSIFKSIRSGDIKVNSSKVKQNHRVKIGDILYIYKPLMNNRVESKKAIKVKPLNRDRIVFENNHVLIYNKPAGVLVHGEKDSLDNRVKQYLADKIESSLSFSSGPLHRLDRNTSGLITFSVSLNGARTFTNMLQDNQISKKYLAVVDGVHTDYEEWEDKLERNEKEFKSFKSDSGKIAITTFTPIYNKNNKTIALLKIITGRTHQIRVQCSLHNRPLTGDIKYNHSTQYKAYYLSALSLTFSQKNDIVNNKTEFVLPLKSDDKNLLNQLFVDTELKKVENLLLKELNK